VDDILVSPSASKSQGVSMFVAKRLLREDFLRDEQIESAVHCGDYLFLGMTKRVVVYDVRKDRVLFEKKANSAVKRIAACGNEDKIYLVYADLQNLHLCVFNINEDKLELVHDRVISYQSLSVPYNTIPDKISLSKCSNGEPILLLFWKSQKQSDILICSFTKLLSGDREYCVRCYYNGLISDYFLVDSTCDIFLSFKTEYFRILRNSKDILNSKLKSLSISNEARFYLTPKCIRGMTDSLEILFIPDNLTGMLIKLRYYHEIYRSIIESLIWAKIENRLFLEGSLDAECREYRPLTDITSIIKRDGLSFLILSKEFVILLKVEGSDLKEYAIIPLPNYGIENPIYALWTRDDEVFVVTHENIYKIHVGLAVTTLKILERIKEELSKAKEIIETKQGDIIKVASVLNALVTQMELLRVIQMLEESEAKRKTKDLRSVLRYLEQAQALTRKDIEKLSADEKKLISNILDIPQQLPTIMSENPDKITNLVIKLLELVTKATGTVTNPLIFTILSVVNSTLWLMINKLQRK